MIHVIILRDDHPEAPCGWWFAEAVTIPHLIAVEPSIKDALRLLGEFIEVALEQDGEVKP